jgi:hypothetical protein
MMRDDSLGVVMRLKYDGTSHCTPLIATGYQQRISPISRAQTHKASQPEIILGSSPSVFFPLLYNISSSCVRALPQSLAEAITRAPRRPIFHSKDWLALLPQLKPFEPHSKGLLKFRSDGAEI